MEDAIRREAQDFLSAWFDTRRVVQTLNFNRFQQEGLSATQFILLTMLGEAAAPGSAADIARRLNVDVTTTMRTADTLAARGLLARARDPADRRRTFLALTPLGREAHARIHGAFVDQVTAAFAAMPPRTRKGLVAGLAAFVTVAGGEKERTGGRVPLPSDLPSKIMRQHRR